MLLNNVVRLYTNVEGKKSGCNEVSIKESKLILRFTASKNPSAPVVMEIYAAIF